MTPGQATRSPLSTTGTRGTHQVHHHVLVEGIPPFSSHLAHVHDGLGVVRVHVKNGGIHDAGHVGGVGRGAGHARVCGEADLQGTHRLARGYGARCWAWDWRASGGQKSGRSQGQVGSVQGRGRQDRGVTRAETRVGLGVVRDEGGAKGWQGTWPTLSKSPNGYLGFF